MYQIIGLLIIIFSGCISQPDGTGNKVPDDSFVDRKRELNFEKGYENITEYNGYSRYGRNCCLW